MLETAAILSTRGQVLSRRLDGANSEKKGKTLRELIGLTEHCNLAEMIPAHDGKSSGTVEYFLFSRQDHPQ